MPTWRLIRRGRNGGSKAPAELRLPNAFGPSPLGSCNEDGTGEPTCPDMEHGENYYACPAAGCIHYVVRLNDAGYLPGTSTCTPYPQYAQNPPATENVLVKKDDLTNRPIETAEDLGKPKEFPHYAAKDASKHAPICPITAP